MDIAVRTLALLSLAASSLPVLLAQTAAGGKPAPAPSPSPNVQVLKGLSSLQLQRTMNLMRASLGVHCDYCHVVTKDNGWQWERDDKDTKRTARGMIQLVMDINRQAFGGRPVVNCNTCHRGSTTPAMMPPLPQAAPSFPTAVADRSGYDTVKEVLARYVGAVGGETSANRLSTARTIRLRGMRDSWDAVTVPFEVVQSADRFVVTLTSAEGKLVQAFDGAGGWVRDAKGTRDLSPAEMEYLRSVAAAFRPFSPSDVGESATVEGKQRIGDRETWEVFTEPDAHTQVHLFFDAQNGLLLRRIVEREGLIGRIPEQLDFSDYRPADGATVPFVQRLSLVDPWVGSTRRLEEVRLDVPVDEAVFRR
jgi:hypothetical protein